MAFLNPKASYIVHKMIPPLDAKIETASMIAWERQGVFHGDQLFVHDSWWEWDEESFDNIVKAFHIVENIKKSKSTC